MNDPFGPLEVDDGRPAGEAELYDLENHPDETTDFWSPDAPATVWCCPIQSANASISIISLLPDRHD